MRMQNGTSILENSLAIIYKVKHILIKLSGNPNLMYLPKRMKIYVYKRSVSK